MLSKEAYSKAAQFIAEHKNIVVVPHANVDPDGISSALACATLFKALGKNVTVICPDTKPENLAFLPGYADLEQDLKLNNNFVIRIDTHGSLEIDKLQYTVEDNYINIIITPKDGVLGTQDVHIGDSVHGYDALCIVDTADLALLGSFYATNEQLFHRLPILNIDHHASNPQYGTVQLIDSAAASATEVLYHWFMSEPVWKEYITADMATLLLTGLITDTRSFQNPNTTPESLEVAAELLDLGARQQEIIQNIYKTKPLSTLKIWGRALHNIQIDQQARVVWSSVSKEDLAEMGATSKETHGILDELLSAVPNADVYILFTELESGGLKASARSNDVVNVNIMAQELFGGGGHDKAAGFKIKNYENFSLAVLEAIQSVVAYVQKSNGVQLKTPSSSDPIDIVKVLSN